MAARLEDVDVESLAAVTEAAARARSDPGSCAVVLVEGMSDQAAVQTLAERSGRDLNAEGVFVVPMGGATNVGHFVDLFGPGGFGVRLAGLCDQGEERDFRRGLDGTEAPYFVCVADLEDELIRALGTGRVEDLIEAEGESGPFLTFTRQPAHRDTARARQLRRFMGTRSGRKIRYGHLLAAALDLTVIPAPLAGLLSAM
jgi:hypothetical protein